MSIPSEEVLINALNHNIRREILKILQESEKTYSQLLNYFAITTGKLNYHLRLLEGMIEKDIDNKYQLTPLGTRSLRILQEFQTEISEEERPLIRKAYISQTDKKESFLYLMYVTRMKFKFGALIATSIGLILTSTISLILGVNPIIILPTMVLGIIIAIFGVMWVLRIKRTAPEFIEKMDRLLDNTEKNDTTP